MINHKIVIVVEGTDGSGKSFIINEITPWLIKENKIDVFYNHLRPNLLPDIGILLRTKKKSDIGKVNTNPHLQKPSGFLGSLARWSYYMLDYTIGYLINIWYKGRNLNCCFIFDRYYYDYYFDYKRSRTKLPHYIFKLGEKLVPCPDLILCLGGDPQKIYERKPETSLKEVTKQILILKEFCSARKNAVWIDTTLSPEDSISAAIRAIKTIIDK